MAINKDLTHFLKVVLLLFFLFATAYFGREFFIPLTLGVLFATLFLPVCKWFESKKINHTISCLLSTLILLIFIAGFGGLIWWQGSELANQSDQIEKNVNSVISEVQKFIQQNFGMSKSEQKQQMEDQQSSAFKFAFDFTKSVLQVLLNLILILVYVFIILYYRDHIKQFILKLFKSYEKSEAATVVSKIVVVSQQYLWGLAKAIVVLWVAFGLAFSIIGVKNPFLYAVICGLMEIIPVVGTMMGVLIVIFGNFAQGAESSIIIGIIISYAVIQFLQSYFLEPVVVGGQVRINALATISVLIIGQIVWGIPGMILAIPLTGMFKIICDHVDALKPYGFLLGDVERKKKK